ncbi:MAG: malto-oligosyltrehalose trehalohydrolase [Actinomycetaceae bacterium]|nr:malto-oligosyltrehalose trehalohydrolase [Actinomycetaceae bacterium]
MKFSRGRDRVGVWAPFAHNLDVVTYCDEHTISDTFAMEKIDNGWWQANNPLPDNTNYAFRIDGGPAIPDPSARWLPYGVHGPCRTWNPESYQWKSSWSGTQVLGGVIYEMHIGTFSPEGTFDGAIAHLDHLVNLGVDCIELMPLAPFPGHHNWGYDGVSLYAIHAPYGGPAGLQRFVDAAHQRGLAVCCDVVLNHLGPEGNYLQKFGPYFTSKHSTPWGDGFNTDDKDCREVRDYLIGVPLSFIRDFRIDAIRLDAVHAIKDDSPTHLLSDLSLAVDRLESELQRPVTLIAESDLNNYSMVLPREQGGYGIDAQWDDDVHHGVHVAMTGETHGYFKDFGHDDALCKAYEDVFYHDGTYSSFRHCNWGRPVPPDFDRNKFVVFSGNHDQIGNRALGDRPSHYLDPSIYAAQAALILLSPYTPMLFMGEEWAASTPFQYFTDYGDPDLGKAVSQGRLDEFSSHGWEQIYGTDSIDVPDPQSRDTFERSHLRWDECQSGNVHHRTFQWYQSLIKLRNQAPELSRGTKPRLLHHDDWIALCRGNYIVVIGLRCGEITIPLSGFPQPDTTQQKLEVELTWNSDNITISGNTISLRHRNCAVLCWKTPQ